MLQESLYALLAVIIILLVFRIFNDNGHEKVKFKNRTKEKPCISFKKLNKLLSSKLSFNITTLTYLGHGDDFDSFSIKLHNYEQTYVIRIIKKNTLHRIESLLKELRLLSELNRHLLKHNIEINIPNYNNDKHSICSLLQNTNNPDTSLIYATYPIIYGKQLYNFSDKKIPKLLANNSDKIATFLSVLHQYIPQSSDGLICDVTNELEWMVSDLNKHHKRLQLKDKKLSKWIKTQVINKCNNVIIPTMTKYDILKGMDSSNKIIKGLMHGDLNGDHLLFKNNKLHGIIDWTDARIGPIAAEFRYLWAIDKERALDIVRKYKNIRKFEKDKIELFDACVCMYGYIELVEDMYWNVAHESDKYYVKYVVRKVKKEKKAWKACTDKLVKIIRE